MLKKFRLFTKQLPTGLDSVVTAAGVITVATTSTLTPLALPLAGMVGVAKLFKNLLELRADREREDKDGVRDRILSEGLQELRSIRISLDLIRDLILVFAVGSLLKFGLEFLHSLVIAPVQTLITVVLFVVVLALLIGTNPRLRRPGTLSKLPPNTTAGDGG